MKDPLAFLMPQTVAWDKDVASVIDNKNVDKYRWNLKPWVKLNTSTRKSEFHCQSNPIPAETSHKVVNEEYVAPPNHDWVFFPRVTRDQAIFFQQFDSEEVGRGGVFHAAAVLANNKLNSPGSSSGDDPPRESIKARMLCLNRNSKRTVENGGPIVAI